MKSSSRDTNFSSQRTAIPFGKFESGSDDVFPCNESMVGREGARAKLIDFLTNVGTRKAILVTGRRGMGKTSFVNYCLKEYEEARVERYWRSDIGRTFGTWVWLLLVCVICTSVFVLGSQLLEILLLDVNNSKKSLLWVPLLPLVFCLGYPLFHAINIFAVLWKIVPSIPSNFIGYLSVSLIFLLFLHIPDNGSAIIIFSRLLVMIAAMYLAGEWLGIYLIKIKNTRVGGLVLLAISILVGFLTKYFTHLFSNNNGTVLGDNIIISNLFIASVFLGLALIFQSINLDKKPKHIKKLQIGLALKKNKWKILFLGMTFYYLPIVLIATSEFSLGWIFTIDGEPKIDYSSSWAVLLPTLILVAGFRLFFVREEKKMDVDCQQHYLYPSALLALKAIFFILLSLYALHPLLSQLKDPVEKKCDQDIGYFDIPYMLKTRMPCNEQPSPKVQKRNIDASNLATTLTLFGTKEKLAYIAIIVAISSLIFWVEYEWIIRPGQIRRRDQSMGGRNRPSYYDDFGLVENGLSQLKNIGNTAESARKKVRAEVQNFMWDEANVRERHRVFEALTFLGYFKHFHLTTIVSTINLGFEDLDHRSVIHAMLLDIRKQYFNKFVSFRSPLVVVRTVFFLCLAMLLVAGISNSQFNLRSGVLKSGKVSYENQYCQKKNYTQTQSAASTNESVYENFPRVPGLFCELGGQYSETLLPLLYFELIPIHLHLNEHRLYDSDVLSWLFDIRTPYYLVSSTKDHKQMSFCVYHFLLFALVFYLFKRVNRTFELVPFSANLEEIDDLLHALTSTTKTKSNRDLPKIVRLATALSGTFQENEKSTERTMLDPRLVELQFMGVLEKICYSRPIYFSPLQSSNYSPIIEITFIFDELDKLATDINSQQQRGNADSNDSELHRLNLMKGLLSNMKRIITSSEARYIFLGGRLLHDEWLADGARRQPLLTSIFSDEIYLPSLLTDASIDWYRFEKRGRDTSSSAKVTAIHPLHSRIEEYFVWQYYLARLRFEPWVSRFWAPIVALPEWDERTRGFIQLSYSQLEKEMGDMNKRLEKYAKSMQEDLPSIAKNPLQTLTIRYIQDGKHLHGENADSNFEYDRLSAFIQFLAYRSAGNPKRLNELLASFMMMADRALDNEKGRDEGFNCQDVLYLPDNKIMRIQLIARVYRQLRKGFEEKIRGRDDKTIVSLIYLSDFLFKFHGRAFSWESLELIDELVHMHRGHDLRSLLHELVEHYTDRYLHRIINGMYSYRFRGYFANEIEYLSRHSEEEMAAFNFTLDEAQMLRNHLEGQLDSGDNRGKTDVLSMLGELHEFYQEYEIARQYYRRCIQTRSPMLKSHVGDKVGNGDAEMSVIQAIYTNKPEGRDALLALQQWGPMTLRWFLQIVMTYEREHSYNNALIRYERHITFAESMIQAFATEGLEKINPRSYILGVKESAQTEHIYVLEYLGLLFEPLFAYAWLLEKNSYTSGTSHFVLATGIKKYEKILNQEAELKFLGLVKAQWYKKIGALCFYKGLAKTEKKFYLSRAQDYYSNSAIQLSLYFRKCVQTTYHKVTAETLTEGLLINHYPTDYLFSVAECLGDLSESILGTIDPIELFRITKVHINSMHEHEGFEQTAIILLRQLDQYFFDSKRIGEDKCVLDQLAKLNYSGRHNFNSLNLVQKYDLSLNLALASSFYMLRAGYIESAARAAMHTAEVVAQYFNWYWFDFITKEKKNKPWQSCFMTPLVIEKIIWYSKYLPKLFRSARSGMNSNSNPTQNRNESNTYLIGELIPSSAFTSLCSIGMSLSLFPFSYKRLCIFADEHSRKQVNNYLTEIGEIIELWTGKEKPFFDEINELGYYKYFEGKLIYSLRRHRYPVLNQLNALKTLVDSSLVYGYIQNEHSENTIDWLLELQLINKKYNHPFHFTPMQSGLSFYFYWYLSENRNLKSNLHLPDREEFDLHAEFRQTLVQSLDMCHMGRGYYEAIQDMYYLYDDFNDNQIHRNHAMQMAGTSLTKRALKYEERKHE